MTLERVGNTCAAGSGIENTAMPSGFSAAAISLSRRSGAPCRSRTARDENRQKGLLSAPIFIQIRHIIHVVYGNSHLKAPGQPGPCRASTTSKRASPSASRSAVSVSARNRQIQLLSTMQPAI